MFFKHIIFICNNLLFLGTYMLFKMDMNSLRNKESTVKDEFDEIDDIYSYKYVHIYFEYNKILININYIYIHYNSLCRLFLQIKNLYFKS